MTEFKKNDTVVVTIEDIGSEGEGIGHIDGFTLFVKDSVIGDVAEVLILKVKKSYGYAKLLRIIEPSEFRIQAVCPVAAKCGGCQLQHMSYEKQLEFKQERIKSCLEHIGGLKSPAVEPIIGMQEPFYYRNKAQFPVGKDKDGNIVTGFYAGHTHSIINNIECSIQNKANKIIMQTVRDFMVKYNIEPYDEESHTGLVRHVLTRIGYVTGEVMICLVINGKKLPHYKEFIEEILKLNNVWKDEFTRSEPGAVCEEKIKLVGNMVEEKVCKSVKSICLSVNTDKTNVILGSEIILLYGDLFITDYIGDVKYHISPLSFFQVNPVQTKKLYFKVLEYAALTGKEVVWDLYCGIGTISLFLAKNAKSVYGVEIIPEAIEDAKENAIINNIGNTEFFVGAAEEILPKKYEDSKGSMKADVIVVDPPRKGCDEKLLSTITAMQPNRIVYVSCNPATLARDVKYLEENGYRFVKAVGVDQFPQSTHVETVVMLSHKKPDSVINVKVEFGEGEGKVPLDNIAKRAEAYKPKERVTYKMIKEYIEAKYGFKVHTAYIAEVKRDLGLPMYDALNAVEELKQPRKHPTAEKAEAIKDALKHYKVFST